MKSFELFDNVLHTTATIVDLSARDKFCRGPRMRYTRRVTIARKILSNTFVQIGGKVAGALVSVFIVKLITNFLGVSGYGQYVSVYEFLAFFGILSDFGLFTIAVREMAKEEGRESFIVGNVLTLRTVMATAVMLLAVGAAFLIPQYQDTYIPAGVAVASLSVFFGILNGTVSSVLQLHLKMQYPTFGLVLGKLVSFAYMVYVVYYGFTTPSTEAFNQLMWAGVGGNAVMVAVTWFYARKYASLTFRFDVDYWKSTLLKAWPYGLALILNMVYLRVGSLLLLFLKNPTEVGLYGVPARVLDILSIIPIYFMNSVLPVLTRKLKDSAESGAAVVQHSFDFMMVLVLPIVAGAQVLAYPLVFIVSSPEFMSRLSEGFYGSDVALQILVVSMMFAFISSVFNFTLIAMGFQNKLLYVSGVGAIVNVALNFLLIPQWGFRGTAVASVIGEIVIVGCAAWLLRRHLKFKLRFGSTARIAVSAAGMAGVVWWLRDPFYSVFENLNVVPLVAIGGIVYAILLCVTGVLDKEKLALLKGRA